MSPEDEGAFGLPLPPVPASDTMDRGYRLLDAVRRWLAHGNDERAQEVAQIVVDLGPETVGFALERAFTSALDRGEENGWHGPA